MALESHEEDERARATRALERMTAEGEGAEALMPLVYDRLHDLASSWFRGRAKDATLQPTALVHEAYLRLIDQTAVDRMARAHFCAVAAISMRQILIQRARRRATLKRGGAWQRVELASELAPGVGSDLTGGADLLALHEALERLAELHERQARIVEMRFFGGLTTAEAAEVLGVSTRTVELDWRAARAWLRGALESESGD